MKYAQTPATCKLIVIKLYVDSNDPAGSRRSAVLRLDRLPQGAPQRSSVVVAQAPLLLPGHSIAAALGASASADQGDGAETLTGLDFGRARFVHSSVDSVRALCRKCGGHRPHDLVS